MSDGGAAGRGPDRYPVEWEADVVLRDGTTTHVRPIRPEDADALQRFHVGQSERSTYLRFFAPMERLSERDLERFTRVDHVDRVALVAVRPRDDADPAAEETADDAGEDIIGVARFDRTGTGEAEVAFNIADSAQGRGLGSVLLEHVAAAARERGVRRFTAEVLPQNGKMLAVFREAGYDVRQQMDDGFVQVSVDLDPTERSRAVMADREHRAEARSMQGLLGATSVVLVGPGLPLDGRDPDDVPLDRVLAHRALAALVRSQGVTVHVVGGGADVPDGGTSSRVHATLADVPGPVDLAVVALPPPDAIEAVRQLARLEVRGVVVLSAGFAETGPDGLALQRELLRVAHTAGLRVVGPASYGLLRTGETRERPALAATLAEDLPLPGAVGLFSQSAPMAVTLLATTARRGLGVSSFLSAGHRADVSGNDLMQYWQDDAATQVVCLYLESIGNPRKFSRIARRLASVKPVVVVTAGRSGQVVPPGHAVRSTRAPRRTLEEMLRQSGVIRAENTHHMIDIAQLLAHQPLPGGRRVGILASSASLAALVAEASSSAGLVVARSDFLPEDASPAELAATVDALYAPDACDVVVVVQVPVVHPRREDVSHAVALAAARTGRTTVASMLGLHGLTDELSAPAPDGGASDALLRVPAYSTPEDAVAALGAVVRYARWREADHGTPVRPAGVDAGRARALVEGALAGRDAVDLDPATTADLLACYGVRLWPARRVRTADEAVEAAREVGWPVALKSTAAGLRHRADLGGVRLDIADEMELRSDVAQMREALAAVLPGAADQPFEVQAMADAGVACVVRSTEDQLFGPVVSFGLAGDAVDLLGDVAYGVPPLTDVDVAAMVRSVRAAPRLFGYMGTHVVATAALEDVLARVSVLADDLPEVRSLELYPVVVSEHEAAVLSARVTLADAQRADALRRALPG
ncbi:acyl-CoA synthetase (NDP forming)/GNAT superfamily N-acetyltransferase [Cellulosimicrobium cellulans]|uniref:bifunctional acetate--CoA ligase family protein/GNAT family N-acetyltransferase n=1 Tax=Cellulosimicrobium cellulans TaxID=1710 RepID=UPI00195D72E2|nr:GNAT family N-acetyltransferase [Cellulosimicrobium cellulans]MBM7819720.1 acyl-CoA synthetase (NDP forming)/GNAT superfamily N-acetyltransferase [Cellulosimicrobium cellulans]